MKHFVSAAFVCHKMTHCFKDNLVNFHNVFVSNSVLSPEIKLYDVGLLPAAIIQLDVLFSYAAAAHCVSSLHLVFFIPST